MDNKNIAETNCPVETMLKTGAVRAVENRSYLIEAEGLLRRAVRAVGCLIEPEINDTVMICIDTGGTWYILSVLCRESAEPVTVPFEHGVSVRVDEGAFAVETPDMNVAVGGKLSITGRTLVSCMDTVRLAARCVDTMADRLVQRISRCYRTVDEFEESRIGRLRLLVRGKFFLASKDTHIRAEEVVKVNGEKILLG
ncbi:DUF3540 domain-containing protein [bacterium]|nr:DUF3540 domain-containing protein [bacterium]